MITQFINPFSPPYYIRPPSSILEWLGEVLFLALVAWGIFSAVRKESRLRRSQWFGFSGLLFITFITSIFLGFSVTLGPTAPLPGRNEILPPPVLMLLSSIPWMLAAGTLGTFPAVILATISGTLQAYLGSHNPYAILEMMGLALVFSLMIRQRYRTRFYRVIRHPLVASLLLTVLIFILTPISLLLMASGMAVARIDYALQSFPGVFLAMVGTLMMGSLVAEVVGQAFPRHWGNRENLRPSPVETSLQARFLYNIGGIFALLVVVLLIGDWLIAQNTAQTMLEGRLLSTGRVVAESVPYLLETGQNLLVKYATDERLINNSADGLQEILKQDISSEPYFTQLVILDASGSTFLASFPKTEMALLNRSSDEDNGIHLASKGLDFQEYTAPALKEGNSAQVAFIAPIKDKNGKIQGILWGRTDLDSNPFSQPMINALKDVSLLGGRGQLIDENWNLIVHPDPEQVLKPYFGQKSDSTGFRFENAPDGTRQLVYFQPAVGARWYVVLSVPTLEVQKTALNMALPLVLLVILIAIVVFITIFIGLRVVTASLVTLSEEAGLIAQGQLDHSLPKVSSVDEVGQLSTAFEKMRVSLKARLDELHRLLMVSQGVAATLDIQEAMKPVMKSALTEKAILARVVLEGAVQGFQSDFPNRFGLGPASETYAILDEDIINLTRQRGSIVLRNLHRSRVLNPINGLPPPGALASVPLMHENHFLGALWVAYATPHPFLDEEIHFLNTIAGSAALAVTNVRLYTTSEIERQHLEAVLSSTPDPVLVTDHQNRLLISNPAALNLPGLVEAPFPGKPIQDIVPQGDLLEFLTSKDGGQASREIIFPNGKTYYATAAAIVVDGKPVGKVCILRDITRYKELDALKSDFVATVSHDLRSPLTLMRGYATMLPMVGELNEQQKSYTRKIVSGVESMTRLVSDLLDLGRIEAGVGLKLEKLSVSEVVDRVVSSLNVQAAQKNIKFGTTIDPQAQIYMTADPALVQQAIYNLVDNAIKYTPVSGSVQINVLARGKSIQFAISDSGIGIAPLDQPRLFEKFYRGGQREAHQQRGSGLGLAIVKSIAERHHGKVWFESQLGRGSTFYLEIPVSQD